MQRPLSLQLAATRASLYLKIVAKERSKAGMAATGLE